MALTRTDETELLTALHEGAHETPRWRTFLERLRRRTGADDASLMFGRGDVPLTHVTQMFAGRERRRGDFGLALVRYDRMRVGRVYSADEVFDLDDPGQQQSRRDQLDRVGVQDARFMRFAETRGTPGWISIMRGDGSFAASDSARLAALAPHLGIALRNFVALEQERFRCRVAEDGLRRMGIDWTALDAGGRIMARHPDQGGKQRGDDALVRTAAQFTGRREGPVLILLQEQPGNASLLVAAPDAPLAAPEMPAAIAFHRSARALDDGHATLFATQFGLTSGEAKLAVELAQGRGIADAAGTLGYTLETARNYSKKLYAKTATRGQADLVRRLWASVAILG